MNLNQESLQFDDKNFESSIKGYIFFQGKNNVLLSAPHAQGPSADNFTGELAFQIAKLTNSGAIIGTISREKIDYNRATSRDSPFRQFLSQEISRLHRKYRSTILLDIHGVAARGGPSTYIGTQFGKTASPEVFDMILETFWALDVDAALASIVDPSLIGGDIIGEVGNPKDGIHAIQIEIDQRHRELGEGNEIIQGLILIIKKWIQKHPTVVGMPAVLQRLKGIQYPIDNVKILLDFLSREGETIPLAKNKFLKNENLGSFLGLSNFPILTPSELLKTLGSIWSPIIQSNNVIEQS